MGRPMRASNLKHLRDLLAQRPKGPVSPHEDVEQALVAAWDSMEGTGAGRTYARKLMKRTEGMHWAPPLLSFTIERHGGTVMGSTRAELHRWTVDVETGSATCDTRGFRQVLDRDRPLNVKPIAEDVAAAIRDRRDDSRLKWSSDKNSVLVLISTFIDGDNQQTRQARRRRFRQVLEPLIASEGWSQVPGRRVGTYAPSKHGTGISAGV
jgi:hypothetical protein